MADRPTASLLSRLTARRPRAPRAPEPADLGTAFGMERWLDDEAEPAPASASVRASAAPGAGWQPRWLARVRGR